MARRKRRPKPLSPKAGIKRTRYGCGEKQVEKVKEVPADGYYGLVMVEETSMVRLMQVLLLVS